MLDEHEDFSMTAHVEVDGEQRVIVSGYLIKQKADGVYRAQLIPQLFYGENGQQLSSWRQYLTAGDHVILSRSGGNPHVPDSELNWVKVAGRQPQPQQSRPVAMPVQSYAFPLVPLLVLVGAPIAFYLLYKLLGKASRW